MDKMRQDGIEISHDEIENVMKYLATLQVVWKFRNFMLKKLTFYKARKVLIQETFLEMAQEMQDERSSTSRL